MTDNNINNNQGQYHKGSFTNYQKKDITYEINERLGIISEDMNGWTRELNLVSWNGGKARIRISIVISPILFCVIINRV